MSANDARWRAYRYRVVTITRVTPVIRELWLAPYEDALAYQTGQYVLLGDVAYRLPPRSYSIANAPRPDHRISLLVTRFAGGRTSSWVHDELAPGAEVAITGPYGVFGSARRRSGRILLLAAGSGLAPIRALAEDFLKREEEAAITLFFSARTAADVIDRARFSGWQRTCRRFHFLLTLTQDATAPRHQRIPRLLPEVFENLSGFEVFVAGPAGFVVGCAAAARALGADPSAVQTEEFFADPEPWLDAPSPTSKADPFS